MVGWGVIRRLPKNRAISDGDRARAGVGESAADPEAIRRQMSGWTDQFLEKFITISKSDTWRKEASALLSHRKGVSRDLLALRTRRAQLRPKRTRLVVLAGGKKSP